MMPYLDKDTNVLYVASTGSPTIQFFHFTNPGNDNSAKNQYVERLGTFKSNADFKGFAVADKLYVDVKKIEVNQAWHLGKDRLLPI
mmetsp:Transcript_36138/g.66777  ORF Transcript_36138/g.66777 Transcript_36138/m.66777 type:complete len:86 (-) Transcript_36138:9-266(-)